MTAPTLQSIEQLSVAERIQLVEDIWDTIARAPVCLTSRKINAMNSTRGSKRINKKAPVRLGTT